MKDRIILKATVLGSGTSQGVPVIGCTCPVCQSNDPRDHRLRTSLLLSYGEENIVIDAGPDFRYQMLRAKVTALDALVLTHEHNDHIIGLDDIRPFNFMRRRPLEVYATSRVQEAVMSRFGYIFDPNPYPGAPSIHLKNIQPELPVIHGSFEMHPIQVMHATMPVLGFRIGDFTYITDAKTISDDEIEKVKGTDTLILNALHHKPHYSHLNLDEAIALIDQIQPRQTYLTHVSHNMGRYEEVQKSLPNGVSLAYDGLMIEIPSYR